MTFLLQSQPNTRSVTVHTVAACWSSFLMDSTSGELYLELPWPPSGE